MAKKPDVNKAAEIRKYFASHPDAKGVDVVEALKKKGIDVSAAQVSNVKNAGAPKRGPKPGKKSGVLGIGEKIKAALALLGVTSKQEAHELIDTLGDHK
jgi:hypothetical protein